MEELDGSWLGANLKVNNWKKTIDYVWVFNEETYYSYRGRKYTTK